MDKTKKTLVVISGASRGIGRQCAVALAEKLSGSGSEFVLLGRDEVMLEDTKRMVTERGGLTAKVAVVDNSEAEEAERRFKEMLVGEDKGFEAAIVIHNAGSLGRQGATTSDLTAREVTEYFASNLVSAAALNAAFLHNTNNITKRIVINISSLMAIQPQRTWSLYCSGKAARDMFFKVVAQEEPQVRVLNYAPGPVLTEMATKHIQKDPNTDPELRQWSLDKMAKGEYLKTEQTVSRLMEILEKDNYKSGDHIDYFDQVPN